MRVGRRKPPVLAEVSGDRPDRPGTLRRRDLEAYGGLLEQLRGSAARTVLMTGSREGRREAAVGLAVGLATASVAAGTRTALLECDLVEPGLADALGLARAPGLHEHLRGGAAAESILVPVVLAGPGSAEATDPLVCVPAGRPSADGARLFDSSAFVRALAGLRAAYDLVVVDGPPLRDEHSLRALLPLADATIACLGRSESRSLPVTVDGLLIQG
jgi:Mrp family chromosome partitioning ATPase